MRWAILSDVHGNLEALQAVLEDARAWPCEGILCAGDIVGYGPDPEACIALLCEAGTVAVLGNHEEMVLGRLGFERCVPAGIHAALWTRRNLSQAALSRLAGLPSWREVQPDLLLTHGAPGDVQRYLSSAFAADAALDQLGVDHPRTRILVCGHTHAARLYRKGLAWGPPPTGRPLSLDQDGPWLLNPGSVGQPRDGQILARYARYDDGARVVEHREVAYRADLTRRKLRAAGLAERFDDRSRGRRLAVRWEILRDRLRRLTPNPSPASGEGGPVGGARGNNWCDRHREREEVVLSSDRLRIPATELERHYLPIATGTGTDRQHQTPSPSHPSPQVERGWG